MAGGESASHLGTSMRWASFVAQNRCSTPNRDKSLRRAPIAMECADHNVV